MKPDWKDLPSWVNWIAMDCDGEWWIYRREPSLTGTIWSSKERCESSTKCESNDGWDISLERRP